MRERTSEEAGATAGAPRVERKGEGGSQALYLHDAAGEVWRVHDVVFAQGKDRRVPLGDARANYRVFRTAANVRRVAHLTRSTSRALDAATLAEQLRGAGYLGTSPARPPVDPR